MYGKEEYGNILCQKFLQKKIKVIRFLKIVKVKMEMLLLLLMKKF
jgi:hypothetical protein